VSAQDSSTPETSVLDIVSCYACGLDDVDPEKDVPGSFGDAQRNSTPPGKYMYNFTCDIVDKESISSTFYEQLFYMNVFCSLLCHS
jgi:hypothetical protein